MKSGDKNEKGSCEWTPIDGYRNKRAEDFDYWLFPCTIKAADCMEKITPAFRGFSSISAVWLCGEKYKQQRVTINAKKDEKSRKYNIEKFYACGIIIHSDTILL